MFLSLSSILTEAISITSTSLQQRRYIYLSFVFAMSVSAPIQMSYSYNYVTRRKIIGFKSLRLRYECRLLLKK